MKILFYFAWLLFPLCTTNVSNVTTALTENADTCFYSLHIPPDLDVPTTPAFDTLIVRAENCNKQILLLPSQGTETAYTLRGTSGGKTITLSAHFFHGTRGLMDITDLDPGTYSVGLMACGNGGAFTIRLK